MALMPTSKGINMYFIKRLFNYLIQRKASPQLSPDDCMHLEWIPESRDNDWRSYCAHCKLPAAGSCQG